MRGVPVGMTVQKVSFEAVKCNNCGRIHEKDSDTYINFIGNVIVGSDGGVVGNSEWDKFGVPHHIFCRENRLLCLSTFVSGVIKDGL
jgi:hypothetical protein